MHLLLNQFSLNELAPFLTNSYIHTTRELLIIQCALKVSFTPTTAIHLPVISCHIKRGKYAIMYARKFIITL